MNTASSVLSERRSQFAPSYRKRRAGQARGTDAPAIEERRDNSTDYVAGLPSMPSLINIQSMIYGVLMASMTIRDIDEKLKAKLRIQAARHGRSMEDEARDILRTALSVEASRTKGLVEVIRARIEPLGGVELEIAPREAMREPLDFDK